LCLYFFIVLCGFAMFSRSDGSSSEPPSPLPTSEQSYTVVEDRPASVPTRESKKKK